MCKTAVVLIIGLLLGCSGSDKPLAPTVPESLIGDYTGTISYWQYRDTDSAVTASAEFEISFDSDSTFSYNVSIEDGCGYFGCGYEYENGALELRSTTLVTMMCIYEPLDDLNGAFRVAGTKSTLLLYRELPELEIILLIELNKTSS